MFLDDCTCRSVRPPVLKDILTEDDERLRRRAEIAVPPQLRVDHPTEELSERLSVSICGLELEA
jgi:hypothetical protein